MNRFFFLVCAIFSLSSNSQELNGKIFDSKTGDSLLYVNITLTSKNRGTTSNESGVFSFTIRDEDFNDTLMISHIGYKNHCFPINKITDFNEALNVYLKPDVSTLNEIILSVKKAKYTANKTLGVKKKKRYSRGTQFGYEVCSVIENETHKKGRVTGITFFVKAKKKPQYKTLPTYYRVKFYKYNVRTKQPGQLLSYQDIIIKPENKTQKINIALQDYNILFPKDGLCVGIVTIKPSGVTIPENPMYTTAPSLVWVHGKTPITWSSYRGKKWSKNKRKSVFYPKLYINPLIHLKVQYQK